MVLIKKSKNVPKVMQEKFQAIAEITDFFSRKILIKDYAHLIRYAIAALFGKRPPLHSG